MKLSRLQIRRLVESVINEGKEESGLKDKYKHDGKNVFVNVVKRTDVKPDNMDVSSPKPKDFKKLQAKYNRAAGGKNASFKWKFEKVGDNVYSVCIMKLV